MPPYSDEDGRVHIPASLTLASDTISPDGIFLLDDGRALYLWIGHQVDPQVLNTVFEMNTQGKSVVDFLLLTAFHHIFYTSRNGFERFSAGGVQALASSTCALPRAT